VPAANRQNTLAQSFIAIEFVQLERRAHLRQFCLQSAHGNLLGVFVRIEDERSETIE
jgi:hypothetical protein